MAVETSKRHQPGHRMPPGGHRMPPANRSDSSLFVLFVLFVSIQTRSWPKAFTSYVYRSFTIFAAMKFEWSILWKPATWLRAIWTAANVFGCTCRYPIRYCTVRCAVCCTACLISWWSLIKWSGFLHNAFLSLSTQVEHLITKNISCSCLPLPALTQLSLLRRRVPKDVKYHLELRRAVSHSVTTAGYPYATNNSEYVGWCFFSFSWF